MAGQLSPWLSLLPTGSLMRRDPEPRDCDSLFRLWPGATQARRSLPGPRFTELGPYKEAVFSDPRKQSADVPQ